MKDFYKNISRLKDHGFNLVTDGSRIRFHNTNNHLWCCPITAIYYLKFLNYMEISDFRICAEKLKLRLRDINNIQNAADYINYNDRIRKKIIDAYNMPSA